MAQLTSTKEEKFKGYSAGKETDRGFTSVKGKVKIEVSRKDEQQALMVRLRRFEVIDGDERTGSALLDF
ncbi:hypothetical protein Tco_1231850 [Tanacetum coccineum]